MLYVCARARRRLLAVIIACTHACVHACGPWFGFFFFFFFFKPLLGPLRLIFRFCKGEREDGKEEEGKGEKSEVDFSLEGEEQDDRETVAAADAANALRAGAWCLVLLLLHVSACCHPFLPAGSRDLQVSVRICLVVCVRARVLSIAQKGTGRMCEHVAIAVDTTKTTSLDGLLSVIPRVFGFFFFFPSSPSQRKKDGGIRPWTDGRTDT